MDGKQRIYYALGQLAYVVAMADGAIQKEEREKLHQMIADEVKNHDRDFDYSDIIFELLDRDVDDPEMVFHSAISDIESASYYLTDDMKSDFPAILEKIARAKSPITDAEADWLKRIKEKLEVI